MAAPEIDAVLEQLEESVSEEIYYRGLHTSPWLDLPETGEWEEGRGISHETLTYDRSLPANPLNWADIGESDGDAGGSCLPPKQRLEFTKTRRDFNMQHTALESPDLCVMDLKNAFIAEEQLDAIHQILGENTRNAWIERNRDQYVSRADHKIICTQDGFVEDNVWLTAEPDTVLSGGMLKKVFARMVRLGAGTNSNGMVEGRPTFVAITGMETSERIVHEEENRDTLRYSSRVPELLAPLGAERLYKGFWLVDDVFPPRWNYAGGWVKVPPYVWEDGKLIENPAYDTASYEDTIIFHADVYRMLMLKPTRNYRDAEFDHLRYRGEWKWLNIQDRDDNPDRNYGFYRGVFASGSKAKFPQYGFVLRHQRCDLDYGASACSES